MVYKNELEENRAIEYEIGLKEAENQLFKGLRSSIELNTKVKLDLIYELLYHTLEDIEDIYHKDNLPSEWSFLLEAFVNIKTAQEITQR